MKKSVVIVAALAILVCLINFNYQGSESDTARSGRSGRAADYLGSSAHDLTKLPFTEERPRPSLPAPATAAQVDFWQDLLARNGAAQVCKDRWQMVLATAIEPTDYTSRLAATNACNEPDKQVAKLWAWVDKVCGKNLEKVQTGEVNGQVNAAACADVIALYRRRLIYDLTIDMDVSAIADVRILEEVAHSQMVKPELARKTVDRIEALDPANVPQKKLSAMLDIETAMYMPAGAEAEQAFANIHRRLADAKSPLDVKVKQEFGVLADVVSSNSDRAATRAQLKELMQAYPEDSLHPALVSLHLLKSGNNRKALEILSLASVRYPTIPQYPKLVRVLQGFSNEPALVQQLYLNVMKEMML